MSSRDESFTYEFETHLAFSEEARDHHIEVRGAPVLGALLRPRRLRIETTPHLPLRVRRDPAGNLVFSGEIAEAHRAWTCRFRGWGKWTRSSDPRTPGDEWQSQPGALTGSGPALDALWRRWTGGRSLYPQVEGLSELLARGLAYLPGVTDADTPAERAAHLGVGVCQDWAHIFLALWRRAGGEARYVAGLAVGEGETHAWVEVDTPGGWSPWDPLRRCPALVGYLPVARGRDAADCRLNRGVFRGGGLQTLTVRARLAPLLEAVR